jgi:hypothetical protein
MDLGFNQLNQITICSLDHYCDIVCSNFSECNVDFTWQIGFLYFQVRIVCIRIKLNVHFLAFVLQCIDSVDINWHMSCVSLMKNVL